MSKKEKTKKKWRRSSTAELLNRSAESSFRNPMAWSIGGNW